MANDNNELQDAAKVELNPDPDDVFEGDNLPQISERPADGALVSEWVDYCVSLGASREHLEGELMHLDHLEPGVVDDEDGNKVTADVGVYMDNEGYTKADLQELASSLGG